MVQNEDDLYFIDVPGFENFRISRTRGEYEIDESRYDNLKFENTQTGESLTLSLTDNYTDDLKFMNIVSALSQLYHCGYEFNPMLGY